MTSYSRLYCKNCKSIYSVIKNIGLKQCRQCGSELKLKSFNPWYYFIGGAFILLLGIMTLILQSSPIIWIGGFIWGASMMFKGFDNWEKIKKLDDF
jgi:hypothetical protein